ncbi:MAG: DUF5412 family protein [Candidatus Paceibacterota bacterium]|jgi:hypothetical protein
MIKRILIIIGIISILIVLAIGFLFYFIAKDLCDDTQIGKYKSSDSKYEVNYYRRGCGATTPFVENLELNGKTILRAVAFGEGNYDDPFQIKWINNQQVSVVTTSSTTSMRIYKISESYKNVKVIFDEKIQKGTKVPSLKDIIM